MLPVVGAYVGGSPGRVETARTTTSSKSSMTQRPTSKNTFPHSQ